MVSLPVVPTYYDEHVGPDAEFKIFLKKLCSEIGLAYNSKECQRVAVFTQPQPKGSIYARGLYQWRRDEEAEDFQKAAQKMAGDDYIATVEKAGPDTRTPAQKAWDELGWAMVIGAIVFVFFVVACIGCCTVCCSTTSEQRAAKKVKKARKQREKEERKQREKEEGKQKEKEERKQREREERPERRKHRVGYLGRKSRTPTTGDVEMGNVGQVLMRPPER
ncbi:hypothetical protein MMC30_007625 [Trapelia coarctata]|nr:hypothetical protein [Trapelia coarctata]